MGHPQYKAYSVEEIYLNLLKTCRAVHQEAWLMPFFLNTFAFGSGHYVFELITRSYSRNPETSKQQLSALRHVEFQVAPTCEQWPAASSTLQEWSPNLEGLHIILYGHCFYRAMISEWEDVQTDCLTEFRISESIRCFRKLEAKRVTMDAWKIEEEVSCRWGETDEVVDEDEIAMARARLKGLLKDLVKEFRSIDSEPDGDSEVNSCLLWTKG